MALQRLVDKPLKSIIESSDFFLVTDMDGKMYRITKTQMVSLMSSAAYAGSAVPATNPGSPVNPVFYTATTAGTYANFGGIVVASNEPLVILSFNGTSWTKQVVSIPTPTIDDTTTSTTKVYSSNKIDTLLFTPTGGPFDRALLQADFDQSVIDNPYDFTLNGSGEVITAGASANVVNTWACGQLRKGTADITFTVGVQRLWVMLGYANATNICAVGIGSTGVPATRVVDINLSANTFVLRQAGTGTGAATGQTGRVLFTGTAFEVYVAGALIGSISLATLQGLGANIANVQLGLVAFDTTSAPNYSNTSILVSAVTVKGDDTGKTSIYAPIDDTKTLTAKTWSSDKIAQAIAASSASVDKLNGLRVSVLGDSISTTSFGGVSNTTYWPGVLADRHIWQLFVDAISGTPIAEKSTFSSFVTDSRWQSLNSLFEPQVVLIFGGTNDFGARDVPLGTLADDPVTNKTNFYGGVKYLFQSINNRYKTAKIFCMFPIQRGGPGSFPPQNTTTGKYFYEYIDALEILCQWFGVIPIRLDQLTGINYWNMQSGGPYSTDLLHPNASGHLLIANAVEGVLKQHFV